jgi:hypothetical protein
MRKARDLLYSMERGPENDIRLRLRDLEDERTIRQSVAAVRQEALDFRAIDDAGLLRVIMSAISTLEEFGIPAYLLARNLSGEPTWYVNADTGDVYQRGDTTNLMNWWSSLGQPASPGAQISAMCYDATNNCIYVGGLFTQIGGVSATNIAKYDVATKTYSALSTGLNGQVYALAVNSTGLLYVGGAFTDAGGDANADKFAKWNGSAFSACGTAFGGIAGNVYSLAVDGSNNVYIGGTFDNVGSASGDRIVKWTGSAYVALGSGLNGNVNAIAIDGAGLLYVGGAFTDAGGDANADKFCKWTGTAFVACGTAFAGSAGTVSGIALDTAGLHCWKFLEHRGCQRGWDREMEWFCLQFARKRIRGERLSRRGCHWNLCLCQPGVFGHFLLFVSLEWFDMGHDWEWDRVWGLAFRWG